MAEFYWKRVGSHRPYGGGQDTVRAQAEGVLPELPHHVTPVRIHEVAYRHLLPPGPLATSAPVSRLNGR